MAEKGIFFTTGATGDGATAYTQAEVIRWLRQTFCGADNEGICKDYQNELATTGTSSPVATNTGAAYVHGFAYWNTTSVDTAIPTPSGNTRIDRLVLRAGWAAQTIRITRIAGTEGSGTPPSITQTDGTTWDIPLCQCSITTGGVITVTDEREFLHPNIGINTDMLDDDAVTLAKMAVNSVDSDQYVDGSIDTVHVGNDQITPAKIPNRTRKFFAPAVAGYNTTDAVAITLQSVIGNTFGGLPLPDGKACTCFGHFHVPEDFASGMTVTGMLIASGTGNIYAANEAYYGACGTAYNTHSNVGSAGAEAVTQNDNECVRSLSIASAATGDIVSLRFHRHGNNASDTVSAEVSFFGWVVEYTADC